CSVRWRWARRNAITGSAKIAPISPATAASAAIGRTITAARITSGGAMKIVASPMADASTMRRSAATPVANQVSSSSVCSIVLMAVVGLVGGQLLRGVFEGGREALGVDQPRRAVAAGVDAQVRAALVQDGDGHQLAAGPELDVAVGGLFGAGDDEMH